MSSLPGILEKHERNRANAEAFKRIASKISIDNQHGCWEWTGASQSNNYGRIWDGEKTTYAHRFVWIVFYGPIESGLDIDWIKRATKITRKAVKRKEKRLAQKSPAFYR